MICMLFISTANCTFSEFIVQTYRLMHQIKTTTCTVGSKIIRALEISHVKKSYLMQFYEINFCQVVIFRLYTV